MALTLFLASAFLWWVFRRPSQTREWTPEQAELAWAVVDDSLAQIHQVRNFAWSGPDQFTPEWETRTYNLNRLDSAWFAVVPFSQSFRGLAHTFVSFGFQDSTFLAVSVEARRELGESYSPWRGLLRSYELVYVMGEEQDLIGRRAVFDGTDVYLYPIQATPEKIRAVFLRILDRVNTLHDRPEFYNTLTNNCTTNLLRHANQITPGRIPYGKEVFLPGYADELAYKLGLIDTTLPIEQARAQFLVNDRARRFAGDAGFSTRIRTN